MVFIQLLWFVHTLKRVLHAVVQLGMLLLTLSEQQQHQQQFLRRRFHCGRPIDSKMEDSHHCSSNDCYHHSCELQRNEYETKVYCGWCLVLLVVAAAVARQCLLILPDAC